jgi:hypothetical protein
VPVEADPESHEAMQHLPRGQRRRKQVLTESFHKPLVSMVRTSRAVETSSPGQHATQRTTVRRGRLSAASNATSPSHGRSQRLLEGKKAVPRVTTPQSKDRERLILRLCLPIPNVTHIPASGLQSYSSPLSIISGPLARGAATITAAITACGHASSCLNPRPSMAQRNG